MLGPYFDCIAVEVVKRKPDRAQFAFIGRALIQRPGYRAEFPKRASVISCM